MLLAVRLGSEWRREVLRTNLWFVPTIEVVVAIMLFGCVNALDHAAYSGDFAWPSWVISGTADAARQILTAIAAAVITVVGVLFSITMVTLTLASTQFGPRMLRNFVRDRGTHVTLGTFVATFVYAVLALVSIGPGGHGDFVPHASVTMTLAMMVADLGILIYFIHHTATFIQLPQVIASIASDVAEAIEVQCAPDRMPKLMSSEEGLSVAELRDRLGEFGGVIRAPASGYLQFVRHAELVSLASEIDAVIQLDQRPGHFLVQGHPFARVWPADATGQVAKSLEEAHIIGPYRMLAQDVSFGIDQLVEIAIRALSPAVNDTFTALTCIDWLGDCLCKITVQWYPTGVHHDDLGRVRLITAHVSYDRLVQRAFEKIRQCSNAMPAVMIRQLEALAKIMDETRNAPQRQVLLDQAAMIKRAAEATVVEKLDRADVVRRYDSLLVIHDQLIGAGHPRASAT